MIPLLFEMSVIATVTFFSGLSVIYSRLTERGVASHRGPLKLAYIIELGPDFGSKFCVWAILDRNHVKVFDFSRDLGHVSSNLYRSHGHLYAVGSAKNTANLYRSVIGNSGYIEVVSEKNGNTGVLPNSASSLSSDTEHARVYVSAKIKNHEFELLTDQKKERFIWSTGEGSLFRIDSHAKVLAAVVESDHSEARLNIEDSKINPLIALCLFLL